MKSRSRQFFSTCFPMEVKFMTDFQIEALVHDRIDTDCLLDSVKMHSFSELVVAHKAIDEALSVLLGFPNIPETAHILLELSGVYAVEIAERFLAGDS